MTDEQLVRRVREGDDEAFAAIVRCHRDPLLGFATRLMGGSVADGEDVVQEALVRALDALRADDRAIALRAWLFAIVRNRAFDHLRAPHRRRTEGDSRLQLVVDRGADPAERAVAGEELRAVVGAIAALPARQRRALAERELGGASHVELARAMGTTIPGAKSLIVRARAAVAHARAA